MSRISRPRMMSNSRMRNTVRHSSLTPSMSGVGSLSELHKTLLMGDFKSTKVKDPFSTKHGLQDDEEITEIREAFLLFDKDNDGSISMKELSGVLHCLGYGHTKKDIKHIMQNYDTDKNGCLDFGEFVHMVRTILSTNGEENDEEQIRRALRVFDADGDGLIRVEDFRYALTSMGEKLTEKEFEHFIKQVNVNKDGLVDYQQLLNVLVD